MLPIFLSTTYPMLKGGCCRKAIESIMIGITSIRLFSSLGNLKKTYGITKPCFANLMAIMLFKVNCIDHLSPLLFLLTTTCSILILAGLQPVGNKHSFSSSTWWYQNHRTLVGGNGHSKCFINSRSLNIQNSNHNVIFLIKMKSNLRYLGNLVIE